jgi:hypothetical protein
MEILGRFVGKAVLDSRVLDFAFNPCFFMWITGDWKRLELKHVKACWLDTHLSVLMSNS